MASWLFTGYYYLLGKVGTQVLLARFNLGSSMGKSGQSRCAQTEHVGEQPKVGRGEAKPRKQTGADSPCEQLRRKMGLKVG